MKKENMFEILAQIEDEKITEAEMKKRINNKSWMKLGTLAACLAVAVAISLPYLKNDPTSIGAKDIIKNTDIESTPKSEEMLTGNETNKQNIGDVYQYNTLLTQEEKAAANNIIVNNLKNEVERSDSPELKSYRGKIPEAVWNMILEEFEQVSGVPYYDFIARFSEKWGWPEFYSIDGYKEADLTEQEKLHDYVFKFNDFTISLSRSEAPYNGMCKIAKEAFSGIPGISIINGVTVEIYKTPNNKLYSSLIFNGCYYDVTSESITEDELILILSHLTEKDERSEEFVDIPADTNGSYAEAVNTDILSEASQNIFCGSFLDENGEYVILTTENASDTDKSQLLAEIGRTQENTTFKTAKYTMKYLTELQERISDAMINHELSFVSSSGIYDDKNLIIVTVTTEDKSEYQKLYDLDTFGGAIEITYTEEQFTLTQTVPKTEIEPEHE